MFRTLANCRTPSLPRPSPPPLLLLVIQADNGQEKASGAADNGDAGAGSPSSCAAPSSGTLFHWKRVPVEAAGGGGPEGGEERESKRMELVVDEDALQALSKIDTKVVTRRRSSGSVSNRYQGSHAQTLTRWWPSSPPTEFFFSWIDFLTQGLCVDGPPMNILSQRLCACPTVRGAQPPPSLGHT